MEEIKKKQDKSFELLKKNFNYKNKMSAPKLVKVVLSSGTGSGLKRDKKINEVVFDRLTKITGQKPSLRKAKKSVASFKIRQGDPIGVMVNLRGERMYSFLDKLINIAFPRTKDFRGLKTSAVDEAGNLTIGIKEHIIFPETSDEELKDVFGLAITLVSTAKNKKEATAFFELIGIPFRK
ncbi:50S ribosomal protein L5 [Candidatus Nomurabacteria bacterium RIFCSPLOWO2_01_FULL_33_24]|uniref:Large ribosomal subunit protein uL5 n=1 Tax=Candidatus Nomurabacteria bacterium RIFCSPLOWO2_01_FULL_33_24 TaxID=1801765 RepID=A0A1F6X222_9BACT|nr:MAG: 50S ribosomal protein L5 [Candidatus Nomurabacteria bacterium RIFCSPLOWO2_01_FULL_33_24]